MESISIKFSKKGSILPQKQTIGSSGFDVYVPTTAEAFDLFPGQTSIVYLGFSLELPEGIEAQIRTRSGLAREGIVVFNAPGTIDADYRGEIAVMLHNHGHNIYRVSPENRIAQLVFTPIIRCQLIPTDELTPTVRGDGSFGSTGI